MTNHLPPLLLTREEELAAADMPDLRAQAPAEAPRLFDGERLIYFKHVRFSRGNKLPSTQAQLYRLTRSNGADDVGQAGPALASLSLSSQDEVPEMHLYEAVFGRDSLRVAMELLSYYPRLTQATLKRLAENQGVGNNAASEEQPGRIPHEIREPDSDQLARLITQKQGWEWPYYGSVDVTFEYIRTLSAYCGRLGGEVILAEEFQGRDGKTHTMADSLVAAVDWIKMKLGENKEGLVEYRRMNPHGLENQVWKDSWDSYMHADGTLADYDKGIASVEVQRLAYDALLDAADLYERVLGRVSESGELRELAGRVRAVIWDRFWTDDRGGFFILGTDRGPKGRLRPLAVKTSNMGHLLHSRLLEGADEDIKQRRRAVIRQLFSAELLNVSGIRTLATDEARFRPGSYHNGSVWLWDTHLIAQGLEQHGYFGLADVLKTKIQNVQKVTHQFPEYVRGDGEDEPGLNTYVIDIWDSKAQRINRLEQPPQQVQAWSVAAILAIAKEKAMHGATVQSAVDKDKKHFEEEILAELAERDA